MTRSYPLSRLLFPAALLAVFVLAGCVEAPKQPAGLSDVMQRPAESALLAGIRSYDDAQYTEYTEAEQSLNKALATGLASPKDRATANKLLAFIYCTSNRLPACEQAFRAARQADPGFVLSRSEAGHPLWGPVYKRVVPQ
jgi:Tfp pilus assembly protein PilF